MSRTLSARGDPTPIPTPCCNASSRSATRITFLGPLLPQHIGMFALCLPPHLRRSVDLLQPLLPWDRPQAAAAVAFATATEGSRGEVNVRRGEDWSWPFHNVTTQTRGGPRHHVVDDMIWMGSSNLGSRPRGRVSSTARRGPRVGPVDFVHGVRPNVVTEPRPLVRRHRLGLGPRSLQGFPYARGSFVSTWCDPVLS